MASVYEMVRDAILTGELEEGAALSQVTLAARLGVSRTPLREALATLQAEGLIEAESNGRVRVSRTTVENIEALYAMRIPLEATAIAIAADRFDAREIERLKQLLDVLKGTNDMEVWSPAHREFHGLLVSKVKDRMLVTIRHLQDGTERYRRLYTRLEPTAYSRAEVEHTAIVDACIQGDGPAAAAELSRHLARTALSVIAIQDPLYEPTVLRSAMRFVLGSSGEQRPLESVGQPSSPPPADQPDQFETV